MNYIKVSKSNEIIKYPYTWNDLYNENPFSLYDDRYTLSKWYEKTEEGISSENKILEVTIQDCSSIDQSKFIVAYDNIPIFENDHWILKFTIEEMDVVVSVKPAAI
jgi:hypothetical protein